MKFVIIDEYTNRPMGQIIAKDYQDADQQADCFIAENSIDREYEYTGYYLERIE